MLIHSGEEDWVNEEYTVGTFFKCREKLQLLNTIQLCFFAAISPSKAYMRIGKGHCGL